MNKMYKWLLILALITSIAIACKETFIYGYLRRYRSFHGRQGLPYWRCTAFSQPDFYYERFIKTAIITCSNVSTNVFLNYTYKPTFYQQDLVIVNSTIPLLPTNSSLSTFKGIANLTLRNLNIEDISTGAFKNLETLQTLDLSNNKLSTIPKEIVDKLLTLKMLDLSNNRVSDIQGTNFSKLLNLKELNLNQNYLTTLHGDMFKDLIAFENFHISNNPLKEFQNVNFSNLKRLGATNTHLQSFSTNLSHLVLEYADLSNGQLEAISLDNFSKVQTLNLASNHLSKVQNWNKLQCNTLSLNNNRISEVEGLPPNIVHLDLSHNMITSLKNSTTLNISLESLNLNFNKISEITSNVFWNLEHLKNLNIAHNNLEILYENTFVNCPSLEVVDLSSNILNHIDSNAFTVVPVLKSLNVSNNKLTTLQSTILPQRNNLTNLYFNSNAIVNLNSEILQNDFRSLKFITINNNSWFCENLVDVLHILRIRDIKILDVVQSDNFNVDGISCEFHKTS